MIDTIDATLEIAYYDTRAARADLPVQVTLDAHGLTLVMANDKGEHVLWHGERRGQGHYAMRTAKAGMEGSLHRFADSLILEGFWLDGRERGFWRLRLPAETVIPKKSRVVNLSEAALKRRPKAPRKRLRRVA